MIAIPDGLRAAGRGVLIVAGLLFCLPFHYAWRIAGRPSPWPRRFLWWVGRAAGMRARVEGRPLVSHVLFVANHSSWLDILLLAGASGTAFVSKEEVGRWPAIGWLARMNETIFVARADRRQVRDQADAVRTALASGQPVALFPEGTTNDGPILPFRPSLLSSLYPPLPGVKLQPVAIDYGRALADLAWVGGEPALGNVRRVLARRRSTPVTLRFLEPIDPAVHGDRKALAEGARARIIAALGPSEGEADRLRMRG